MAWHGNSAVSATGIPMIKKTATTAALALLFACSCMSTSVIYEYDKEGNVIRKTETKESISKVLTNDLKNKTVVQCTNGWGAEVNVGAQLESGMTPSFKMAAGKLNWFYGSFLPSVDAPSIAGIIQSWHENLNISPAGIVSGPSTTAVTSLPSVFTAGSYCADGSCDATKFTCGGDCDFYDLRMYTSVVYLQGLVDVLSKYDGTKYFMQETGESYADVLKDFGKMLEVYKKYGCSDSKVVVHYVSVHGKAITKLMFSYVNADGTTYDVQCPNCTAWEPEGYEGE